MAALSTIKRRSVQNNWNNQLWLPALVLAILAVGLITADYLPIVSQARAALLPFSLLISTPTRAVVSTIDSAVAFLSELQQIRADSAKANSKIVELEKQLQRLTELEQENSLLRKQLDITGANSTPGMLASVLRYEFTPAAGFMLLQISATNSVEVGQLVVSGNQIVGFVDQRLNNEFVRVQMINASNFSRAAIVGDNKILGQWTGRSGLTVSIENIPSDININIGDNIQLAQMTDNTWKQFYLGEVTEVVQNDADPLQKISAKPLIDLYSLEQVIILNTI